MAVDTHDEYTTLAVLQLTELQIISCSQEMEVYHVGLSHGIEMQAHFVLTGDLLLTALV